MFFSIPNRLTAWRTQATAALLSTILLLTGHAFAGQTTLAWDANTDPAVAGYMVYYGEASRTYPSKVDVGNQTTYSLTGLLEGKGYYYAVTAYDSTRSESGFSNEASATIPFSNPNASFGANTTSATAPASINFTSTSTGTITSYSWNFGDGSTSTTQNPSHLYSTPNTYSVTLTVTGPGGSNTLTKNNYITISPSVPSTPAPPVAAFSADRTTGTVPLTVAFTSNSTGSITSYAWTFGDGQTSTAQNPSHTYAGAGSYSVSLKVTGPGGNQTQTKSSYITVDAADPDPPPPPAPVIAFTASKLSGNAPLAVNFTSTSTGTINSYAWNFGDGTSSSSQNPTHTYSAPGTYSISLTVNASSVPVTLTKSNYIVVSPKPPAPPPAPPTPPVANFSANKTSGAAPLSVVFSSATSTGTIASYAWNFGDGTQSTAQNPTHNYTTSGTYSVSLTVSNTGGSNMKTKANYITVGVSPAPAPPAAPDAEFTASTTSGVAALIVAFTSTSTGAIDSYFWEFGDGTTSTEQNPTHSYAAPGTYSVSLSVTGPGGSNSQAKANYVTAAAPTPSTPQASPSSSASGDSGGGGGGGCTIGTTKQFDPLLPFMLLAAGCYLTMRRRRRPDHQPRPMR